MAAVSWESLERLVQCADEMHMQRGQSDNSAASVLAEVDDFKALREELKGAAETTDASIMVDHACRRAETQIQESRTKAQVWQREVRRSAQARDATALGDLIQKRDLHRAHHSRALMSAVYKLACVCVNSVSWSRVVIGNTSNDSIMAALECRQPDALERSNQAATDWEASAVAQEEGLARALQAATECVVRYTNAHGGGKAMGRCEVELPEVEDDVGGMFVLNRFRSSAGKHLPPVALLAYNSWAGRVGTDAAQRETDAALRVMEQAVTSSFGSMFQGSARRDQAHTAAVKAAMLRCGEALDAEFHAQEEDFVADMPCHLLISAGRQLMARRTRERVAKAHVRAVVWDITKELEMVQECLDGAGKQIRVY